MTWAWEPMPDAEAQRRLGEVLASWEFTPYVPGPRPFKGIGADCLGFVGAVLDELCGTETRHPRIPADACVHNREKALAAMAAMRALYDHEEIDAERRAIQPGDVVSTGPLAGGPGHVLVAGTRRAEMWHAAPPFVQRTSLKVLPIIRHRVFGVFRLINRRWVCTSS